MGITIHLQINQSKLTGFYYLRTFYVVDNKLLNRLPFPHFSSKQFESLGQFFELSIQLPPAGVEYLHDKEIEFEFVVYDFGLQNLRINAGIDPEFDRRFAEMLLQTASMWNAPHANGEVLDLRLTLKVVFSYKEVD